MVSLDIFFDSCQERGGEVTVFGEKIAVFEINDVGFEVNRGGFGFLIELNEGVFGSREVIIDEVWGGGTK